MSSLVLDRIRPSAAQDVNGRPQRHILDRSQDIHTARIRYRSSPEISKARRVDVAEHVHMYFRCVVVVHTGDLMRWVASINMNLEVSRLMPMLGSLLTASVQ